MPVNNSKKIVTIICVVISPFWVYNNTLKNAISDITTMMMHSSYAQV